MPTTADERPFAEDAMRIADNEMDLAFAQAVRRTLNRPRTITAEAKEADARLQRALRAVAADQAQLASLTAAAAKANAVGAESLNDRLNLVKAQATLDQDEADDARQDLRRAGGDPQGRMDDLIAEHEAASKSSDSIRVAVANSADSRGLVRRLQELQVPVREGRAVAQRQGRRRLARRRLPRSPRQPRGACRGHRTRLVRHASQPRLLGRCCSPPRDASRSSARSGRRSTSGSTTSTASPMPTPGGPACWRRRSARQSTARCRASP